MEITYKILIYFIWVFDFSSLKIRYFVKIIYLCALKIKIRYLKIKNKQYEFWKLCVFENKIKLKINILKIFYFYKMWLNNLKNYVGILMKNRNIFFKIIFLKLIKKIIKSGKKKYYQICTTKRNLLILNYNYGKDSFFYHNSNLP